MNKFTALVFAGLMILTQSSQANPNHHHGHYHRHSGGWIAPLVIGSVAGYALSQATRPVIVQQPPVVYYPNTLPPAPVGWHYEQLLDANCNCYRWVLVSN